MSKSINYSPETVVAMTAIYTAAKTESERQDAMLEICKETGKPLNSIRAKLAQLGIYIAKKAAASAKSTAKIRKADIIADIAGNAGTDFHNTFFDSLEGVNKLVLEYIGDLQVAVMNVNSEADEPQAEPQAEPQQEDAPSAS